jgi:hypothetical protein
MPGQVGRTHQRRRENEGLPKKSGCVSAHLEDQHVQELEQMLQERLNVFSQAARPQLIQVLRLPDVDRADRIVEFWGHSETRTFGELLIDLEGDKAARAVVFGLLAEIERKERPNPEDRCEWLSPQAPPAAWPRWRIGHFPQRLPRRPE